MKKIIVFTIAIFTIILILGGKLYYDYRVHAINSAALKEKIKTLQLENSVPNFKNSKEEQTFTSDLYKPAKNYIPNVPQNLQNYYFSGRWFPSTFNGQRGMMTIQQGQEIYFKVSGTKKVTAFLQDTTGGKWLPPRISYQIDGGKWNSVFPRSGYTGINIADNLTKNEHVIRIMISSLYDDSFTKNLGCFFVGTTQDQGAKVVPVKPNVKTIFAMGDSVTAGRYDFSKEDKKTGNYSTGTIGGSRAEFGYISRAGDYLHSRVIRNAFGGTGVVRKLNTANADEALNYLKKGLKDDYNYDPDLITINYGTNDYLSRKKEHITTNEFVNNYKLLLDDLIKRFPGKPIFMIVPFGQTYVNELTEIADQYKNKNVTLVDTNGWNLTYTDAVHPDYNGTKMAGENLAYAIVQKLGMKYFGLK